VWLCCTVPAAAGMKQLQVRWQCLISTLNSQSSSDLDLQLVHVVVFDVDIEAVLLQQAVHAQFQFADVLFHLVVIHSCGKRKDFFTFLSYMLRKLVWQPPINLRDVEKSSTQQKAKWPFDFVQTSKWRRKTRLTWVAGVLLIEAIDSTKHEVEDHLAVWIVHTWSWEDNAMITSWICLMLRAKRTKGSSNTYNKIKNKVEQDVEQTYWFHLYLLNPHYTLQPETCSAPPAGRMHSCLQANTISYSFYKSTADVAILIKNTPI